jgi:Flp pilus assembly pilin Flp
MHIASSPAPIGRAKHRQRGQGMTEYIIIVALIAVAAIAVFQFFGQTIRSQTAGIAKEVSGQTASSEISNSQTAANSASEEGTKKKGLGAYTNDNSR